MASGVTTPPRLLPLIREAVLSAGGRAGIGSCDPFEQRCASRRVPRSQTVAFGPIPNSYECLWRRVLPWVGHMRLSQHPGSWTRPGRRAELTPAGDGVRLLSSGRPP